MATCTFKVGTADTATSPNTSAAFTSTIGDLLVVFCVASGTVDAAPTCVTSTGITFSFGGVANFNTSSYSVYYWIANSLCASAVSTTVTCDMPTDGSTGTIIFVYSVSGMSLTGFSALRRNNNVSNQAAGGTPAVTFGSGGTLSTNPTLMCVGNVSSPAGITPNASWTEPAGGDLGYSTPTTGGAVCHRDSGFAGTTVTWGGTSATAFGVVGIELDASVVASVPTLLMMGCGLG